MNTDTVRTSKTTNMSGSEKKVLLALKDKATTNYTRKHEETDNNEHISASKDTDHTETNVLSYAKRCMLLILLLLVVTLASIERTVIGPFFPTHARHMNITELSVGIVVGSSNIASCISCLVFAVIIPMVGAKLAYGLGLMGIGIFSGLCATLSLVEDSRWFLGLSVILRILMGIGQGAYYVSESTILARIFTHDVGAAMGMLLAFDHIGRLLGPLVGGVLYDVGGFYLPFLIPDVILIVVGNISVIFLPSPMAKDKAPVIPGPGCNMMRIPTFSLILLMVGMQTAVVAIQISVLSLKLEEWGMTATQAGLVFLLQSTVFAICYGIASVVNLRYKGARLEYIQVIISSFIVGLFITLQGPAPFYHITNAPLWLLIFSFAMQGIFAFANVPALSLGYKCVKDAGWPDDEKTNSLVLGYYYASACGFSGIGSMIGGYVYQTLGWQYLMTGCSFMIWAFMLPIIVVAVCKCKEK